MKALIFTNVFPRPAQPNVGFYVYEQVKRLREYMDVKIVVGKAQNIFGPSATTDSQQVQHNGFDIFQPVYKTLSKVGVFFNGAIYKKKTSALVKEIYDEFPFEIIISYWTYPEGYAAGKFAKEFDVPLIMRPRGTDINAYYNKFLLKSLVRKSLLQADKVIPVSNDLKEKIRNLGISEKKLSYIHNGIDTDRFYVMNKAECRQRLDFGKTEKIVLFVGNFIGIKGVDHYLDAIKAIDEEGLNIKFIFLGRGKLKEKIIGLNQKLNNVAIEIKGDISHEDLKYWINASDLLCLPSINEGCPNVVLEAMACGVPVVASRVGGIPELITDEKLGVLVESGKVQELASAIKLVLNRQWDREAMVKEAQKYSWDDVAREIYENCDLLIKEKREIGHGNA